MRMDKLTLKAQEAIQLAQALAEKNTNTQIDVEHLVSALLDQPDGLTVPILQKIGVNTGLLGQQIQAEIERIPKVSGEANLASSVSPKLSTVINKAFTEAEKMKDEYVSTEHLLVGVASDANTSAGRLLKAQGIFNNYIIFYIFLSAYIPDFF